MFFLFNDEKYDLCFLLQCIGIFLKDEHAGLGFFVDFWQFLILHFFLFSQILHIFCDLLFERI